MNIEEQLRFLKFSPESFAAKCGPLSALSLKTFQLNIGLWCNQACRHCHVDSSPIRTEQMTRNIVDQCLSAMDSISTLEYVDITGGAPEGHREFRYLVQQVKKRGLKIIDRCNLTILSEPGQEDLAEFLAEYGVEIVSSLPHFSEKKTNKQRGNGVFEKSIDGLLKLNALGYGIDENRPLHLVYNPSGILLSGNQEELEKEFKKQLDKKFGIKFNSLYCINNIPVNRYLESLIRSGKYDLYMQTLVDAFNPTTITGLMCRHQINVSWDGHVYDCDFNQMLQLPSQKVMHIKDFDFQSYLNRDIILKNHCFGCTAGAGSSCGGELV